MALGARGVPRRRAGSGEAIGGAKGAASSKVFEGGFAWNPASSEGVCRDRNRNLSSPRCQGAVWEKVKRLGRNQRTILKVLAPCGGPPQPVEPVRWLVALEVHGRRQAVVDGGDGPEIDPAFRASVDGSLERLEDRGLVARTTYPAVPGTTFVSPTADGWGAIETLGLAP